MRFDPMLGSLVGGKYRVEHLLAEGGMGRVYVATHEPLGRAVALKVVRHDTGHIDEAADAEAQERFRFEASVLARLRHPNIVTLYDFGDLDGALEGRSYLAMELLEGATLAERLDTALRLPVLEVLAIAEQMVLGLRFAHSMGVIHRDMKPANVILVRDEADPDCACAVKILDFGTSKLTPPQGAPRVAGLTQDGYVIGTPEYMAPEQLAGRPGPASDLFAVGVIMFEALTGAPPFGVRENSRGPLPRLNEAAPDLDVPASVEHLVARLLARRPGERPQAKELLEALKGCLGDVAAAERRAAVVTAPAADANGPATSGQAVSTARDAIGASAVSASTPARATLTGETKALPPWRRAKWQAAAACVAACALGVASVAFATDAAAPSAGAHYEGGLRSAETMPRAHAHEVRAKVSRPGTWAARTPAVASFPVLPPLSASAPVAASASPAATPKSQNPTPTRTVFSVVDTER